ncbi:hypothetical protein BN7_5714 [Wickerhamomyces ciferrii]|uniref:Uncharacterized protein n=1 Tax=Wickerhamomyces ciferrii (strain ATCC 14091 / BCRC 22168 / CBS 111 / JCM 3599 / NBRC 0793 / NRRL Y-1031 F-60-10) TaxID=1206466 RepID=K0KSH7_WICCF|nr:uncharacterized protein BN7_5714 [Wickerhamomyces ciferrii]CCH46126.1 hypothetical protein BN7_5714 [Wickerhamomyces ciferrii]
MAEVSPFMFEDLQKPQFAYTRSHSSSNGSSSDNLPNTLNTKKITNLPSTLEANLKKLQTRNIELYTRKATALYNEYKQLHHTWNKFNHKSTSTSKTNHLRLSLLAFLRLNQDDSFIESIDENDQELKKYQLKVCKIASKVLSLWWNTLVEDLQANGSKFSTIDRSAYLECISRIISRKEWNAVKSQSTLYSSGLVATLDYCFNKLLVMKNISLSVNAFIGKVFAYGFLNLENFGHMLLFLLFVKNFTIKQIIENNPALEKLAGDEQLLKKFHPSLSNLVSFKGDFTEFLFIESANQHKLLALNCMKPPKTQYIEDLRIDLKDNNWVKKWAGFDSDIFCSFLRHYLALSVDVLDPFVLDYNELFKIPGFTIIYGHLVEILESNIMMIKKFKTTQAKETNFNSNYSTSSALKNFSIYLQKLPIIKVLKVIRDIIYDGDERKSSMVVSIFERILISKAKRVQAYSSVTCEAIYTIFMELLLHLQNDQYCFTRNLNLSFWVTGLLKMLDTDNMICQTRALSMLFNIWNLIPSDFFIKPSNNYGFDSSFWNKAPKNSLIFNLSNYLLSNEVWEKFFTHWHPLVRQFYQRLLIFKIIGNSNDNYSNYLNFKKILKSNLSSTFQIFKEEVSTDSITPIMNMDLMPANPMLNRKLIVSPMESFQSSMNILDNFDSVQFLQNGAGTSTRSATSSAMIIDTNKKIYAYDIFDEAIYSSSIGFNTSKSSTNLHSTGQSTRKNSPTSSPSMTRSSSATTLGRVPILGSALSFFKKVNQSQPTIKVNSRNSYSPSPTSSPQQALSPPYQGPEDQSIFRARTNSNVLNPVPSVSSSSSRSPSFKAPNSILSSPSSSLSDISDEDNNYSLQKHRQVSSNTLSSTASSRLSVLSSANSINSSSPMEALPTPPELLNKVPEIKKFKFRFQLVVANDPSQLQYRIVNASKGVSPKKFFLSEVNKARIPKMPTIPFEQKTNELGLVTDGAFYSFNGDREFSNDSDDEDDQLVVIPRNSISSRTQEDQKLTFNSIKNHLLLGKSLNEWELIVEEYEKYIGLVNEINSMSDTPISDEFFHDPMLIADIPPTSKSGNYSTLA